MNNYVVELFVVVVVFFFPSTSQALSQNLYLSHGYHLGMGSKYGHVHEKYVPIY